MQIKSACSGKIFCKSEGLTRAFNYALHANYIKAELLNPYYKNALLFFSVQFFIRITLIFLPFKIILKYKIKYIDIVFSIIFFVFCFYVFLPIELIKV